jgi:hypothetical protein
MQPKLSYILLSLIPLGSLLLLSASCEREKPDPPTYYIPEEYKLYTEFHPGSYWIYEDSISGAIDSVVVTEYVEEIVPWQLPGEDVGYYYEKSATKVFSSISSQDFQYNLSLSGVAPDVANSIYHLTKQLITSGESRYVNISRFPKSIGNIGGSGGEVVELFSEYMMNGILYSDVTKAVVDVDYSESDKTSYYYIAKDAGLIRYETQNEFGTWRIWKLKRYHAIR